jgi:hypothetical protein
MIGRQAMNFSDPNEQRNRLHPVRFLVAAVRAIGMRRGSFTRLSLCAAVAALTLLTAAPGNAQQTDAAVARKAAVTEQEAHGIGVDAYLYFYPLVTMDITRRQLTNIEPGKEFGKGPMNMFVRLPEFPPITRPVRPNWICCIPPLWLDLTRDPWSSPRRTPAGYYLLPMLDMWSDVSPRRAGGRPERWRPTSLPAGLTGISLTAWSASAHPAVCVDHRSHN